MNKILKRISAYLDSNGKINTNISQEISNNIYQQIITALNKLYLIGATNQDIDFSIRNIINNLKYHILDNIGIYGDSFIKNNKKISIEFQLGIATSNSIDIATRNFNNYINQYSFSFNEINSINQKFENLLADKYYCLVIIIYEDKSPIKKHKTFFNRASNINDIKNWRKTFTNKLFQF